MTPRCEIPPQLLPLLYADVRSLLMLPLPTGLGVFKGVSRRGSVKVALSKAGGAKLGIKMVQDAKEGIVVQGVTAGGQAEGKVAAGSVLKTINGRDVQNMAFKDATKLISTSDDIVTFTFTPLTPLNEGSSEESGGGNAVPSKTVGGGPRLVKSLRPCPP